MARSVIRSAIACASAFCTHDVSRPVHSIKGEIDELSLQGRVHGEVLPVPRHIVAVVPMPTVTGRVNGALYNEVVGHVQGAPSRVRELGVAGGGGVRAGGHRGGGRQRSPCH